jgi:hypothetical protein
MHCIIQAAAAHCGVHCCQAATVPHHNAPHDALCANHTQRRRCLVVQLLCQGVWPIHDCHWQLHLDSSTTTLVGYPTAVTPSTSRSAGHCIPLSHTCNASTELSQSACKTRQNCPTPGLAWLAAHVGGRNDAHTLSRHTLHSLTHKNNPVHPAARTPKPLLICAAAAPSWSLLLLALDQPSAESTWIVGQDSK